MATTMKNPDEPGSPKPRSWGFRTNLAGRIYPLASSSQNSLILWPLWNSVLLCSNILTFIGQSVTIWTNTRHITGFMRFC